MKVFFPLSLKVSLWLLLNLVLLAGVGGALLVQEAGFGWDMLVAAGPADKRLKDVARELNLELRQTPPEGRDEMLARLGEVYGVKLFLFANAEAVPLAGRPDLLPNEVRARFETPRSFNPGFRGQGGGPGNGRRGGPPPAGNGAGSGPTPPLPPTFLQRTAVPTAYWIGVRLQPVLEPTAGGPLVQRVPPSTLLMRADSLWTVMRLLDLDPWLVGAAVAMGLSVIFWLPLVHGITRSLGQLTRATEEIAEGRFDTRVDEDRRDEIGRLGGAVNAMAEQLDRAATGQKRFLGDIAHELGSPVGRMQVAVGILEEQADAKLQPAVADVREEVQQMSELVGELLAFTQAGLRAREAELARVELAPLAADMLGREAAQGKVVISVPAGLAVAADSALLTRALANLVRNALRYGGDTGSVTLSALSDGDEVVIAVEDNGPGVPPDTLVRLGEPFYRPEFARTRETGGVGLGLAIVKSAVEACGGTVRFSNREPHGFRAEVRLAAA